LASANALAHHRAGQPPSWPNIVDVMNAPISTADLLNGDLSRHSPMMEQ
jgi:hypothetical protein